MGVRSQTPRPRSEASRFPAPVVARVHQDKILGIRAGTGSHRIIGVWSVVVRGRIFVRSWSVSAGGWYHTFLAEPEGVMQVGSRRFPVRAVRIRSETTRDAVSRAYAGKYRTPGAIRYVRDLSGRKSRAATIELKPRSGRTAPRRGGRGLAVRRSAR
jgi:hypothetical protein